MRRVVPYPIWFGHAGDCLDVARLYDLGVRAVVQLAIEEPAISLPRDFVFLRIPLMDGAENRAELMALAIRAVSQLLSERVPTLVCCGAGMSRSPCVVAAAISLTYGTSPDDCLKLVVGQGRTDVSPGLWNEMIDLLRTWQNPARPPTIHA